MVLSTTPGPQATTTPPALGESEHDKAMIAAVDAANGAAPAATPAAAPQRPEGVPEKFWDAEKGVVKTEELLKSYSELEKTKAAPAAAPKAPEQKPAEGTPPADDAAAKAAAEAAKAAGGDISKVDFAALSQEFQQSGALSDATYENLTKAGLPRDMVDSYIAGQQAIANAVIAEVHGQVGGKETFDSMLQWAASNLPQGERDAFDTAVTGSKESRAMAVSSLKAKFDAAVGSNPSLVRGGAAAAAGAYASRAEVTRDMSDPRYAKDPAFRAEVERKLASSNVF